jgi:predicted O-methyltransferase YrrM
MSEVSTQVTAEHFRYIAERTTGEDDFLRTLKREASAAGVPSIWISPEQASFMQILLALGRASRVLEIGTLAGYSAIAMARALPKGGSVTTIELDPARVDFARRWVARSDVADKVEVLQGKGMDVLPRLDADSFDAAFLDADKASYAAYLTECRRLVKRGGLILVDNAFAFGQLLDPQPTDREVPTIRAFNDLMAQASDLRSIIVPIGDGLWVGVRR